MTRYVGTVVRGLRGPIVREGDDLAAVVTDTLMAAAASDRGFEIADRDVLGITESVVARTQGNYVTVDEIAAEVNRLFPGDDLGLVFPILSRNRFSILLRAFARAKKKLFILLSYPTDEVGNHLISDEAYEDSGINGLVTTLDEAAFRRTFGNLEHPFTKLDYPAFYRTLCAEEGCEAQMVFGNRPEAILDYTSQVLTCDIHHRERTCARLKRAGGKTVYGLYQLCTSPQSGSGYNPEYGLLGSNKATEEKVKLFPRPCQDLVNEIQSRIQTLTGKTIEVMVYGDGAFKDPVGQIWELADPVVSPAYTPGLEGTPHELKLKYLADNDFADLSAEEQRASIRARILSKQPTETAGMAGQGTTPRRLTDLLGSLFDLTSGSGDKGTPFVYVQGYFDSYAND